MCDAHEETLMVSRRCFCNLDKLLTSQFGFSCSTAWFFRLPTPYEKREQQPGSR